MRRLILLAVLVLGACSERAPDIYKASANVDDASIEALFAEISAATGNAIDAADVAAFVASVPMDEEKQHRLPVRIDGDEAELGVHYWREQANWVHVYASSESRQAIGIFEDAVANYARAAE